MLYEGRNQVFPMQSLSPQLGRKQVLGDRGRKGGERRPCGSNVCLSANPYIQALISNVMVSGGGLWGENQV